MFTLFGDSGDVAENYVERLNEALVKKGQEAEFGDVRKIVGEKGEFLVGYGGLLYRVFGERDVRMVVPNNF